MSHVVFRIGFLVLLAARAQAQSAALPPLRLEDLEREALASHPTIAQAAAAVRAAEGLRRQAGRIPNPVLGYHGEELTIYKDKWGLQTQHVFYLEQRVITGHKLRRAQDVFEQAGKESQAEQEVQRQRVTNAVRVVYYDALAAERLVDVKGRLAQLTRDAVGITRELFNIGQADQTDVLQSEIEVEWAELDVRESEQARHAAFRVLSALVGRPELSPTPLHGDLEKGLPALSESEAAERLLKESPELKSAQARAQRAEAGVAQAGSNRIGDVSVRAGVGYNHDRSHGLGGWIGELELRFALPIFDRRKEAIAAAQAEAEQVAQERRRLELELRVRLANALRRYSTAKERAERLASAVIPRAEKAHQLYRERFREMAAAYPQVLIAQRTLLRAQVEYVSALADAWHEAWQIEGYLLDDGDRAASLPDGGRQRRDGAEEVGE